MKRYSLLFFILLVSSEISFSQIPLEKYRAEVLSLKTEKEIDDYWSQLHEIDQKILVYITDVNKMDSISNSLMIRTALVFEIHGSESYKPNNTLPILNLSHNNVGETQIAFWPIIQECKNVGGVINSFGGIYPAYQLEGVANVFYDYSLVNQENKYQSLLTILNQIKIENIVDTLLESFQYQKSLQALKEMKFIDQWYLQSFFDTKEDEIFSFVIMSDNNLYLKRYDRIQKLELIDKNTSSKVYRIENEPFGWSFVHSNDGNLALIDEQKNQLIKYTKVE